MMQEANQSGGTRLAAIDVGSNSIRLVVAQIHPSGEYRVLDDERETTRLAKSLNTTGQLDPQAMEDSIAALRRFRKIAEGFNVARIRTIATCAVREAENGVEFLHRARQEAGLDVEVITSREEAHFAFRSVERAFELGDKNILLADIGGGSTEMVLASNGHIEEIYNTRLGALRLSESYGPGRQLFGDDYQRLVYEIDQELRERVRRPPFYPHLLIGSGGTFTSLAAMMVAAKGQSQQSLWGYRVTRAEVRHLLDRLQKMSLKQRRSMPGLNADRAEIIVAGLAIIDRIMKRFRVNVLQVHTGGVRDGLLLAMINELEPGQTPAQDRRQAVEFFAASCGVDMAHSRHVAALAGSIYEQLCGPFSLEPKDQHLLETAALLQDVGYLINYESHHKHSYQLILNSQLPGFSRHDLELIANVARYHRGARPKRKHANLRELSEEEQIRVRRLVAILRIAGGLDRSHSQSIDSVRVQVLDGKTKLHVASRSDPEVDLWAARRRARLFERVFQTEMLILPV
jgi:exopolyphosphatase/guanosine-5'-triphosphate,3'-diphosphate pyrophosphatase